jgi:hypothetical protein
MRKVQSGNTVRVNVYAPTETSVASSSTDVEVTTTQDAEAATGGNTLEPLQEDSLTPHQNPLGFKAVPPYFGYEEGSVTCTQGGLLFSPSVACPYSRIQHLFLQLDCMQIKSMHHCIND